MIETALLHELACLARKAYPKECCGVLLGRLGEQTRWAEAVFPVENTAEDPSVSFRLSDQGIHQAETAALERGMELVGFYHSHPDCETAPSETDALYAIPGYSYPILSVWNGRATALRSFVKAADGLAPELINYEKGGIEW